MFICFHVLKEQAGSFPKSGTRVAVLDVFSRIHGLQGWIPQHMTGAADEQLWFTPLLRVVTSCLLDLGLG
jgi:hypothetical protein